MLQPSSKQELDSVLGFVNYLSKFLPRLSEVAQPLRYMTTTNAKFVWSQRHNRAFLTIKQLVIKHPVLRFYDVDEEATVQCDASKQGPWSCTIAQGTASGVCIQKTISNAAVIRPDRERMPGHSICVRAFWPVPGRTREYYSRI